MPTSQLLTAGMTIFGRATLVDDSGPLKAWVERVVRKDPDLRWIVGNYVEADVANDNGHIFPLQDLRAAQHTVAGKPLNMLHRDHYIVGSFAGAQLMAAGKELTADDEPNERPYVEAVAGMWHNRFPEEYFNIQKAHKDGSLFFSMEAVPEEVSCPSCGERAVFAGVESDTYCAHMQGPTGPKVLHGPVFAGGAIIIPPARPGWSRADVTDISAMLAASTDEANQTFNNVVDTAPHLDTATAEQLMAQIMLLAREFSTEQRQQMSKKGTAMPDGSFPIANAKDLRNAIRAVGRAKNSGAAKAHIRKRAKALGLTNLLPEGW